MLNIHTALFVAACVLFLVAALPTGARVRFEWLAFALITLAYIL